MKNTRINLLAALTIIVLALSSFVSVSMAATAKPSLSKKELKVSLKSARTPAEHHRIAAYYQQEAERLTASSKEHSRLAEIYASNPPFPAMEAKHGIAFGQGVSHCRAWAQLDAEQSKKAQALATLHEQMATGAEPGSATRQEVADAALDVRSCACHRGNSQELASAAGTKTFASMGK